MVITVEPGLYIASDAEGVPAELRGIGIRIEDDVAITLAGNEVLTAACPKEIADLEAACRA
jgi:Xaa-Pro aminopeptidase